MLIHKNKNSWQLTHCVIRKSMFLSSKHAGPYLLLFLHANFGFFFLIATFACWMSMGHSAVIVVCPLVITRSRAGSGNLPVGGRNRRLPVTTRSSFHSPCSTTFTDNKKLFFFRQICSRALLCFSFQFNGYSLSLFVSLEIIKLSLSEDDRVIDCNNRM